MSDHLQKPHQKRYVLTILLPTVIALTFLITIIYGIVIPAFEKSFLEGKKTTIEQLTNVVVDIAAHYSALVQQGEMDRADAQQRALREIESLRYGDTQQDYFWICDYQPVMVMHPYSKDLVGNDLTEYRDFAGTQIFLEFIQLVQKKESGFLHHTWHSKYEHQTVSPKLTYVTSFSEWEWIIGTGVYLDDVYLKTDQIDRYLSKFALGVVAIVALVFLYLAKQNLINERKRFSAESMLAKSREKYKALVESAAEPMMMFFDNRCIYSNSSMQRMLEAEEEYLLSSTPESLLPDYSSFTSIENLVDSGVAGRSFDTTISKRDGTTLQVRLNFTEKVLGDETVVLMTAKDLSSRRKIEEELGVSRQRYQWLTNQLEIGIFRTSSTDRFLILDANPVAINLLGLERNSLGKTGLIDTIHSNVDAKLLQDKLKNAGVTKDTIIAVGSKGGPPRMVSISMVVTRNAAGLPMYCDGIVEDTTLRQSKEEERKDLLSAMQSSMMFLNEPVGSIARPQNKYPSNISVTKAAEAMIRDGCSTLLLANDEGTIAGVFGNSELQEAVLTSERLASLPVHNFMTCDLGSIETTTPVFETVLAMDEQNTDHLCLTDSQGAITGIISGMDLLRVHNYSATFLLKEIENAATIQEIIESHAKLPGIVGALTDSGVNTKNISRTMSSVADAVFQKVLEFSLNKLNEPPVPFMIIGLGSEGRAEQTLATDQDNALIFADVPVEQLESVQHYFLELATLICHSLDRVGYVLCKGDVMAMNPRWCQPVSVWKDYFTNWISSSTPQDLMELNIFFDYRCLYGEGDFLNQIRGHLQVLLRNRPVFYHLMAENNLLFKVPLDFFGNISVETDGEHANCFNIKHVLAMIVGFARIHGIKQSLETSNTLERLEMVYDRGAITKYSYEELVHAYDYLMRIRLRHQVSNINNDKKPDNWINLDALNHLEKDMLKKIFGKVATLRKKLTGKGESNIFF